MVLFKKEKRKKHKKHFCFGFRAETMSLNVFNSAEVYKHLIKKGSNITKH